VVLVVDAKGMAASAAALIHGYASHRDDVSLAGVIFNRVGGAGHAALLREACAPLGLPVIGGLPSDAGLAAPDRHLGLVQAHEHQDLDGLLDRAAGWAAAHLDVDQLVGLARPAMPGSAKQTPATCALPPLGQRIAVARDSAFGFAYSYVLDDWRGAGAEVLPFSPLAGQGPDATADAVYLPGGYPELHAGRLAANRDFMAGLRAAAARGAAVYGECGGYMALGHGLEDADGERHETAGLLPGVTSFSTPRLTLGYREVALGADSPLGNAEDRFRGHEFHYARLCGPEGEVPLFGCRNARGHDLGAAGSRQGSVMGSFIHLVDRAEGPASAQQRSTERYGV
jgi:cobyrinic acid a,c-diamide synthase